MSEYQIKNQLWQPRYTLTPAIARGLMEIEAARAVVAHTPLPPAVEAELRRRARVRSTHYSTRIEGNRLTLAEAEQVIAGKRTEFQGLPVPLIAAFVHYQFVTIHPYYDGNGRTARLLATFILHRGGYGLNGFFSLEEHHARDLTGYYHSLAVHPQHNYYDGRAEADLTSWLEYFIKILARVFVLAKEEALRCAKEGVPIEPEEIRRLDRRARVVLALFAQTEHITATEVAKALGLSDRMARELLKEWVNAGWLIVAKPSRRARAYALSAIYRQYIGGLSAMPAETDKDEHG